MVINVLIIDDKPRIAKYLTMVVESYVSSFTDVSYAPIQISGLNVEQKAFDYLSKNKNSIDVILCDYTLSSTFSALDFLQKIDLEDIKPYRILHSVDRDAHYHARSEYKTLYDHFCDRKDETDIQKSLATYENEVLSVKLNGNPGFRDIYFLSERKRPLSVEMIGPTSYFDILYMQTDLKSQDTVFTYYRKDKGTSELPFKKTRIALRDFANNGLLLKRINNSTIINLLWVSKINIQKGLVRFVLVGNKIFEKTFEVTKISDIEIIPYLDKIETFPSFFRS